MTIHLHLDTCCCLRSVKMPKRLSMVNPQDNRSASNTN